MNEERPRTDANGLRHSPDQQYSLSIEQAALAQLIPLLDGLERVARRARAVFLRLEPNLTEGDPAAECRRLGEILRQHPIDAACVGIGEKRAKSDREIMSGNVKLGMFGKIAIEID